MCKLCLLWESNPGPPVYKTGAMPLCKKGFYESYIILYFSNNNNNMSLNSFLINIYYYKYYKLHLKLNLLQFCDYIVF